MSAEIGPAMAFCSQSKRSSIAIEFWLAKMVLLSFVIFLSGCGSLPLSFQQSLGVVDPHQVDFAELKYYAKRSRAAYASEIAIREQFPLTTRVMTIKSIDVLYFLETDRKQKTQTLSIRGTANKQNVWQDIEIALEKDSLLGVSLHRGFRDDTNKVYSDVKPYLKKDYSIRVTGHSLGGAIAVIIAHYLYRERFKVERLVTFGGPKVTNREGTKAFEGRIIVTRVVHDKDVVPMLPPTGFLSGRYQHFGPEVVLRDGRKFVYISSHDSNRLSVGEFWRNITDFSTKEHHMETYHGNILEKIKSGSRQVPYFDRGLNKTPAAKTRSAPVGSNTNPRQF